MFMTIFFGEVFIQAFVHYLIELLIFVAEVAMFPRLLKPLHSNNPPASVLQASGATNMGH